MNALDIVILLVVFFGLWQGFNAGLLRSVVSLFGWLFALIFATYFAKSLAYLFVGFTSSPALSVLMAFIVVALFVIIGLQLILWVMSKTLKTLKLGILDKIGGAAFACAKNVLAVLLVLSLLTPFLKNTSFWQQSTLVPALLPFAPFAMDLSKKLASEVTQKTSVGLTELSKAK